MIKNELCVHNNVCCNSGGILIVLYQTDDCLNLSGPCPGADSRNHRRPGPPSVSCILTREGSTHYFITFLLQDYAQEAMEEITGDLDFQLEEYADIIADSINAFNVSAY